MAMRRSKKRERGASIVEAAVIFPLFLALAFGTIDFSLILTRRMLVRYTHYRAARALTLASGGTCLSAARSEVSGLRDRFGILMPHCVNVSTSSVNLPARAGAGPDDNVSGLNLVTSAEIPCWSCRLLQLTSGVNLTYALSSFYPYQEQAETCENLTEECS